MFFGGADPDSLRLEERRAAALAADGSGARMLAAAAAFALAAGARPASECEALALASLEDGVLLSSARGCSGRRRWPR